MNKETVFHKIDPVYDENCTILLLGSMPSIISRQDNFYYANKTNRFWKVMEEVFQTKPLMTIEDKKNFLLTNHIALWDVIKSCSIKGSSDNTIGEVVVNDIETLIQKTKIKTIYTTGATAKKYYDKYCLPKTKLQAIALPSTSAANAKYKLADLIKYYEKIKINYK